MESKDGIPVIYAPDIESWRGWLSKNGEKEKAVWLIIYHKKSNQPSIYYEQAVEHALCYGWIDSKGVKRDEESSYLYLTPRKATSKWSKPNKERVERMTHQGFMTAAGQRLIDLARQNGTWDALNDADAGIIPDDLQELFDANKVAFANFQAFSESTKRLTLEWVISAKKPETRQLRIESVVAKAEKNIKPRP